MTPDICLKVIQDIYPQLGIQAVQEADNGQYNYVLIADDTYIFRFARFEAGRQQLKAEISLWQALQNRLPIAIPNPLYNSSDAPLGEAFMGYEMLVGDVLNMYQLESTFDDTTCDKLAHQLAYFLERLHTIDPQHLGVALNPPQQCDYWAGLYKRIQDKLYDKMSADAQQSVSEHFEHYLDDAQHFDYTPTLIHGDFGTGNILFDANTNSFSAVLDIAPQLGDPAIDLAALYGFNGRGKDFFARIAQFYPNAETLFPRILFYSGTYALQEALYGVENGVDDALSAGLADYR